MRISIQRIEKEAYKKLEKFKANIPFYLRDVYKRAITLSLAFELNICFDNEVDSFKHNAVIEFNSLDALLKLIDKVVHYAYHIRIYECQSWEEYQECVLDGSYAVEGYQGELVFDFTY